MNPTQKTPVPLAADSAFASRLTVAFRGGAIMLAVPLLWALFLQKRNEPFFNLFLFWLPSAWLVFPVGAAVGSFLPRWVARRGFASAAGIGILVGLVTGLVLAAGIWLCSTYYDLIGLLVNRGSGGYASYSQSVRLELRNQAWHILTGVVPLGTGWVAAWAVWTRRVCGFAPAGANDLSASSGVRLRLDRQVLRLVLWVVSGLAVLAIACLVITWGTRRGAGSVEGLLLVGPAVAGLVFLGPWLGPMINPSGGCAVAWHWTAVALPLLIGGVAPFAFSRRAVRPGTAVIAWCGLVSALLFWSAAGALSLGWSLG